MILIMRLLENVKIDNSKENFMVKKVKRFFVFLLFSLFYSLLSGKGALAAPAKNRLCVVPKNSSGKLVYNGGAMGVNASEVVSDFCYN